MSDVYTRRGAEDYAEAFAAQLPRGPAWPRDPDTTLMLLVAGLAGIWGDVAQRSDDLLVRESDPRSAAEMLPDWERAFGLPDPCVDEPLTLGDRRTTLVSKMTMQGGQSRAFFIAVATALGYEVTIREFSPFMAGISRAGDTRPPTEGDEVGDFRWVVGPPEIRFYWTVKVGAVRLTWFRASTGEAGVDPHVRIAKATDLECRLRQWSPAHTQILFDYSAVAQYLTNEAGERLTTEDGSYLEVDL